MMAIRSLTQKEFDAEYRRINAARYREIGLFAVMDFISAASTSLVIMDIIQLSGIAITAAFALTAASLLFFGVLGAVVLCGVLCGIYIVQEGRSTKADELNLMNECFNLNKENERQLIELRRLLKSLLAIKENKTLRSIYESVQNNTNHAEVKAAVQKVNGYIAYKTDKVSAKRYNELQINSDALNAEIIQQDVVGESKQTSEKVPPPNYYLSNVISFFSGAGFMLGICASILGVCSLLPLLLTPVGWGILAAVLVLAICSGLAMTYVDYRSKQSQRSHIEELVKEESSSIEMQSSLTVATVSVKSYRAIILNGMKHTVDSKEKENKPPPTIVGIHQDEVINDTERNLSANRVLK